MNANTVSVVNTSKYPDNVVRALVRFAQDGRETGRVGLNFKNSGGAYRGRAYLRVPQISTWAGKGQDHLVVAAVGKPERFPIKGHQYPRKKTAPIYDLNDWMEAAIQLVAHELTHCVQFERKSRISEIEAEVSSLRTLERFRTARAELGVDQMMLDAAALKSPAAKVARKVDDRQKKLEARQALLAKWQRKQKLANTKVKKLTREVARLAKKSAEPVAEPKPRKAPTKRAVPELFGKLGRMDQLPTGALLG